MAEMPRVEGFLRVPSGGECAYCDQAADGMYRADDLMPIHEHCHCGVEPVFSVKDQADGMPFHKGTSAVVDRELGSRLAQTGEIDPEFLYTVVTEKGTYEIKARTAPRASQKAPGKTISVSEPRPILPEPAPVAERAYKPQPNAMPEDRIKALQDSGMKDPHEIADTLVREDELAFPGLAKENGFSQSDRISEYLARQSDMLAKEAKSTATATPSSPGTLVKSVDNAPISERSTDYSAVPTPKFGKAMEPGDLPDGILYHVGTDDFTASIARDGLLPGGPDAITGKAQGFPTEFRGVFGHETLQGGLFDLENALDTGMSANMWRFRVPEEHRRLIRLDNEGAFAFTERVPTSWIDIRKPDGSWQPLAPRQTTIDDVLAPSIDLRVRPAADDFKDGGTYEARKAAEDKKYADFVASGKLPEELVEEFGEAVTTYAGSLSYARVQEAIATGTGTESTLKVAADLRRLFTQLPGTAEDLTLWRGMSVSKKSLESGTLRAEGLSSTSVDASWAMERANMASTRAGTDDMQVLLKIDAPAGTNGLVVDGNFSVLKEGEVILGPGTSLKVGKQIGESDGIPVYSAKVVKAAPTKAPKPAPVRKETNLERGQRLRKEMDAQWAAKIAARTPEQVAQEARELAARIKAYNAREAAQLEQRAKDNKRESIPFPKVDVSVPRDYGTLDDIDATRAHNAQPEKLKQKMSQAEANALGDYIAIDFYKPFQQALRDGSWATHKEYSAIVGRLDGLAARSKLQGDITLYRGFSSNLVLSEGLTFTDAAFQSFSLTKGNANRFAKVAANRGGVMRVRAQAGDQGIFGSQFSAEVVMPRNTTLRVIGYDEKDKVWDVELVRLPATVMETAVPIAEMQAATVKQAVSIADTAALRASMKTGAKSATRLTDGAVAEKVELLTYSDGAKAVEKTTSNWRQAQTERLVHVIGEALGARTPAVLVEAGTEGRVITMPFVEGRTGVSLLNERIGKDFSRWEAAEAEIKSELWTGDSAQKMQLLDAVVGNIDRNLGNWIVQSDGTIVGIDHTAALRGHKVPYRGRALSADEWDEVERNLASLKHEFVMEGGEEGQQRELQDMYDGMMGRAKELRDAPNPSAG